MNYPCGKFADCSFSGFGFIVRTDRQSDRQTDRTTYTDADERLTPATVVGMSKYTIGLYATYSELRTAHNYDKSAVATRIYGKPTSWLDLVNNCAKELDGSMFLLVWSITHIPLLNGSWNNPQIGSVNTFLNFCFHTQSQNYWRCPSDIAIVLYGSSSCVAMSKFDIFK